jgi:hypothetical protein
LIILLASVPLLSKVSARNVERANALATSQAELTTVRSHHKFIADRLGENTIGATSVGAVAASPSESVHALVDAYALTMSALRDASSAHLVQVLSVGVGTRQLDAKGVALAELAERVAVASRLRRIRVTVKGRYESLNALHDYLDVVRQRQGVLESIEIKRDQFQASFLVLGVES